MRSAENTTFISILSIEFQPISNGEQIWWSQLSTQNAVWASTERFCLIQGKTGTKNVSASLASRLLREESACSSIKGLISNEGK